MPERQSFKKVIEPILVPIFSHHSPCAAHPVVGPKKVIGIELAVRCATNRKISFKSLPDPVIDKARGGWKSTK
jgi:hypothetical protein